MKKFTKVALILSIIFAVIGIGAIIGAVSLGLTWGKFASMVRDGRFSFGDDSNFVIGEFKENQEEIDSDCRNLDIEFNAGELEIKYGDVDSIQVEQEKVSHYECYVEDDTLHIEGGVKVGIGKNDGKIIITLPKGKQFDEVDIEVGAGRAVVTELDAKELDAQVGAGQLIITMTGEESDYDYELECGIGHIEVGSSSYSGLGYEKEISNPGATRHFSVECGAGEVQIQFAKQL